MIIQEDNIMNSPLAIDKENQILFVNPALFNKLSDFAKKFFVLHELGHLEYMTSDEFISDEYAFEQIVGTEPNSLKQCISAMFEVLNCDEPVHRDRILSMIVKALEFDFSINGNAKAGEMLTWLNSVEYADGKFWKGIGNFIDGVVDTTAKVVTAPYRLVTNVVKTGINQVGDIAGTGINKAKDVIDQTKSPSATSSNNNDNGLESSNTKKYLIIGAVFILLIIIVVIIILMLKK